MVKTLAFEESSINTNDQHFAPSVFSQAEDIIKSEGLSLDKKEGAPNDEPIELDLETLEICVAIPFDIAGLVTKIDKLELSDMEKHKIAKVWLKPLTRLLSKYPNSDVVLAATTTLGIGLEKYLVYLAESTDARNRARDAGKRQDELLERSHI